MFSERVVHQSVVCLGVVSTGHVECLFGEFVGKQGQCLSEVGELWARVFLPVLEWLAMDFWDGGFG